MKETTDTPLPTHISDDMRSGKDELAYHATRPATFWQYLSAKTSYLSLDFYMVLSALVIALIGCFMGEKIKAGGGFGMDGSLYGQWAKDFHKFVFVQGLDLYRIQRILPSAIIHYSMRLLSIPFTDRNVIYAFGILNVLLITLSAYVWCRIANNLKMSYRGRLVGFAGLFLSFGVMKWPSYYPVLTDTSAFFIGLLMLYFYLINNRIGLYMLMVIGAFVWPTLVYQAALFLMFPRNEAIDESSRPARYKLNVVFAIIATSIIFLYMWSLASNDNLKLIGDLSRMPVLQSLIYLTLAISVLYLLFGLSTIWDSNKLFDIKSIFKRFIGVNFFAVLLLVVGLKFLLSALSNGDPGHSAALLVYFTVAPGMAKPGVFYLCHVLFFGPILILALFWWKPVCEIISQYGIGLIACVTLGFLLSLDGESRHIFSFVPLIVVFTAKVADALPWRPYHYLIFVLLSIAFSKVWLLLSGAPLYGDPGRYIDQFYYMTFGGPMSPEMYGIQGAAVLLASVFIYLLYVKPWKRIST